MEAYSSARDEFKGIAEILLDANENPYASEWNRYPDPRQRLLKEAFGLRLGIDPGHIFLGNGSDEAIDLLFRIFCRPGVDRVLTCPPTYGMYKVSAALNDVAERQIPLTSDFQLDLPALQVEFGDERNKLLFLCSPNNPTGNLMAAEDVRQVLEGFGGVVVVDEAYVDFAPAGSFVDWLGEYPNLVLLRTFSKAWGLAGLRVGAALASPEIIALLDRVKPPYNVNVLSQKLALEALEADLMQVKVDEILRERSRLVLAFEEMDGIRRVFPSDANFLLVQFEEPLLVFTKLREQGIVVRDRRSQVAGSLRLTIGTPQENTRLLNAIEHILLPNVSIH